MENYDNRSGSNTVNRYDDGTRITLHNNEKTSGGPVVSIHYPNGSNTQVVFDNATDLNIVKHNHK